MELFPKTMMPVELTPERVFSTLLSLEAEAHIIHLNTSSFAEHKATDELYSGIQGFRDTIMENILGHLSMNGIRLTPPKGISIALGRSSKEVATEICTFSCNIHEWAEEKGWDDLANIADEMQALGTKVLYLLTLS